MLCRISRGRWHKRQLCALGMGGGPRTVLGRRVVPSPGLCHDYRLIEEGFASTDGFHRGDLVFHRGGGSLFIEDGM